MQTIRIEETNRTLAPFTVCIFLSFIFLSLPMRG